MNRDRNYFNFSDILLEGVRKGDSLSLIASRFYGDFNFWSLISDANPQIQGRENSIEIGEVLLVPNLKANCLES